MTDLDDYLKLARAEIELQKHKAKNHNPNGAINAVLIASGILGSVTLIGTLVDKFDIFKNNPEQKWWWERLGKKPLEAKIVKENPNPQPSLTLQPHYLRAKWAHSGTSYDHVSKEEKARRQQFMRATPQAQPKPREPSMLQRSKNQRLIYSSGGGRGYSKEELERIDREEKLRGGR